MKKIYKILGIITLLVCTNCTKNNGDIGDFFGLWRLESLTKGDSTLLRNENLYIGFQSSVITLRIVDEETNLCTEAYGSFIIEDNDSININVRNGNINNYKAFMFDTNPFETKFSINNKELILTLGDKIWSFKKH